MENKDDEQINFLQPDWLLQDLVETANNQKDGYLTAVTLTVDGFLISGLLIGGRKYLREMGNILAGGTGTQTETNGGIRKLFEDMGEETYGGEDNNSTTTAYIHLANARFFHPSGNIPTNSEGVLWRGRLSEVSGFFIGELKQRRDT